MAEGIYSGTPAPPPIASASAKLDPSRTGPSITDPSRNEPPRSDVPLSRWNNAQAAERAERRRTVFAGTPVAGEPTASTSRKPGAVIDSARRIVGVLITYSWQPQGEIFPILEGRNLIGKDPDLCDICIPQDSTLSAVNSFITYRRQFVIGDKVSMSGTDVDGVPVETEFVPLHNYARIRTGSTHWTFVEIPPPVLASPENTVGQI